MHSIVQPFSQSSFLEQLMSSQHCFSHRQATKLIILYSINAKLTLQHSSSQPFDMSLVTAMMPPENAENKIYHLDESFFSAFDTILQEVDDLMQNKYNIQPLLLSLTQQMDDADVDFGGDYAQFRQQQYFNILTQLFNTNPMSWGRICSMLSFTSAIALFDYTHGHSDAFSWYVQWAMTYMETTNVGVWIKEKPRGWEELKDYPHRRDGFNLFSSFLTASAIGVGAITAFQLIKAIGSSI